ncbi:hypothetical protein GQ44DRAFT_695847 [Phaeosphaeriaceae sp. PMI808]|nr:hypothetical protein GQ44DRAFT_695847 [Phaeosphaeriaceae sp. PMI808]
MEERRCLGWNTPTRSLAWPTCITFWSQRRRQEVEHLEVHVMETRKRVLGNEHPATLTAMNNLAFTLKPQGR